MTKRTFFLASSLLLAACSEYDITDHSEPVGEPNPKDLENPVQTDRIVQVTTPEVDILWVIDNSCSMQDEQNALTAAFPIFMDYFLGSGLDYHVGVVSTDMDNNAHSGKLREAAGAKWIDLETSNPTQIFSTMAGMGTSGSATERGRDAAYAALEEKKDGFNAGFIRENASLHAIVISDESDSSKNITKPEFIDYLNTLKTGDAEVTWSSIVNPPTGFPFGEGSGQDYIDITNGVGGILWPIHDGDWDIVLEQLGVQASGLKREYFLSQLPVVESINVYVVEDGVRYDFDEGEDWSYSVPRNSITFLEFVPSALSEVFIEYDILAAYQDLEAEQ